MILIIGIGPRFARVPYIPAVNGGALRHVGEAPVSRSNTASIPIESPPGESPAGFFCTVYGLKPHLHRRFFLVTGLQQGCGIVLTVPDRKLCI